MPHLRSLKGFKMLKRYVVNWPNVILALIGIGSCHARFQDGNIVKVTQKDYFEFYEYI